MNPTAASQQQFCVRWNSHLGSLGAAFPQLLAGQRFVDVTLACEGHQLHCHRLVLAACSSYFESLLSENPCKHPIVIMPHDIKLWEIQALVDFMYKGEVNVSQAGLTDLLKCAELLQIRGLCGADAALNLNTIANNAILSAKESNNGSITSVDGVPQPGQSASGDAPVAAESAGAGATVVGAAIATLNAATVGAGGTTTVTTTPPGSSGTSSSSSSAPLSSGLTLAPPALLSAVSPANSHSNSALKPPGGGSRSNSALLSCHSPSGQTIGGSASGGGSVGLNNTKRMIVSLAAFEASTASSVAKLHQQYSTSTPNTSAILTPKLEPVDVSIVDDLDDDSINNVVDVTKTERDDVDYTEPTIKQPNEKQLHHPTKTQQHLIENLDDDIDDSYRKENRKYKRNIYKYLKSGHSRPPMLDHDYDEENVFIDESDESGSEAINDNKIKEHLEEESRNRSSELDETQGQDQGEGHGDGEVEGVQEEGQDQDQDQDQGQNNDQSQGAQQKEQIDEIKPCNDSSSDAPEPGCSGLRKRQNPGSEENLPMPKRPAVTLKPIGQLQSSGGVTSSSPTTGRFGKIRVKANENLYENYSKIESNNNESQNSQTEDEMIQQLPASLKFNKDEMTIFVKNPEAIERNSMTPGPLIRTVRSLAGSHSAPPSLEIISRTDGYSGVGAKCTTTNVRIVGGPIMSSSSSGSSSAGSPSGCDENSLRSMDLICYDTPEIGETTTVKTEVVISEEEMDSSSNCENIVCSPNVHDYNNFNNEEADDEDDDDEDGVQEQLIKSQGDENFKEEPPYDDIRLDEPYDSPHTASHQVVIPQHMGTQANIPTIIIPTLATYTTHQPFANTNPRLLSTTAQCKVPPRSSILKSAYLVTYNKATGRYRELVGPITVGNMNSTLNSGIRYPSSSSSGVSIVQDKKNQNADTHASQGDSKQLAGGHNSSPNPSPSAVVLRNPRSNQPRSYSTEALYAALMDVKAGESIYRASQLHKVPRKTLRNWMKRWHIKSAFPMPRQLKQAAEKKRLKQMEHKMEKYNV